MKIAAHMITMATDDRISACHGERLRVDTVGRGSRKEDAWLSTTEGEITAIVNRYKNLPGIGGIYLRDEPSQPNVFAPIYKAVVAADPASNPHLNLLPNVGGNYYGYVSDWVATVGSQNLKCLSYDMYPFGTSRNSINNAVYDHLDLYRRVGNTWGVNTGYYMQAMESTALTACRMTMR